MIPQHTYLALSFDDILLIPQKSNILPQETNIETQLTQRIKIKIPILSSPMDTVTEWKMAQALAQAGGIGVIHKNMSADKQARQIKKAKQTPHTPNPSQDGNYLVGAAVSVGDEQFERAFKLAQAGVDVLVIDTAHGHSQGVIEMVKRIKKDKRLSKIDVIAGNIVTADGAYDLIKAGADAVKVGVGPGSICTTRQVAGVGVPQITAIKNAAQGRKKSGRLNIPIIADGGIKYSGDITKALAAGASSVMLGSLLAGTDESPGKIISKQGNRFKAYRGMGSLHAMQKGSKDRYGQAKIKKTSKFVAEGIAAYIPYKGSVSKIIYQLTGGLRAGMGYCGAKNILELQKKAKFAQITGAGLKESFPHIIGES